MSTAMVNSYVEVEIQTDLKRQAEEVLDTIGLTFSQAVSLFMKQIVLRRGFPFELNAHDSRPLSLGNMTEEELESFIHKGLDDVEAGRIVSAEEVRKEMAERYDFKL